MEAGIEVPTIEHRISSVPPLIVGFVSSASLIGKGKMIDKLHNSFFQTMDLSSAFGIKRLVGHYT